MKIEKSQGGFVDVKNVRRGINMILGVVSCFGFLKSCKTMIHRNCPGGMLWSSQTCASGHEYRVPRVCLMEIRSKDLPWLGFFFFCSFIEKICPMWFGWAINK